MIQKKHKVKKRIKELYGTQEIFSVISGINEASLSKIIRGLRAPTTDQIQIFEKLLKCPAEDLLE